jgi:hypothetical protein
MFAFAVKAVVSLDTGGSKKMCCILLHLIWTIQYPRVRVLTLLSLVQTEKLNRHDLPPTNSPNFLERFASFQELCSRECYE